MHAQFVAYARSLFDKRRGTLISRMAERAEIEHRYSCLQPVSDWTSARAIDTDGFYARGGFPNTAARMRMFEARAPQLAAQAIERLDLGADREHVTHLLMTCCTGLSAPGVDLEVVERCKLPTGVERTTIGFMGCYAAINALKLARHIVRSDRKARVLVLNLELCSLHFQETTDMEQVLCFLLFADGCAASLVSAEPEGIALDSFRAVLVPGTRELITWNIRDSGFDMVLSGAVPATIQNALAEHAEEILGGAPTQAIDLWAVHPGGRTVLDAVGHAFHLSPRALAPSREVLRQYGNMSSATVMFVIERMLRGNGGARTGCGMAFGPGLVAETMLFRTAA